MVMYLSMTSLMSWLVILSVLRATEGRRKERDLKSTPFPPPNDQGLFAVVQTLVQQVAGISTKQSRDWSRIRRIDRRSKSSRQTIDVMHADIIQLRQHVTEINGRLDKLEEETSDLRLEITVVGTDRQKQRDELVKMKHSQRAIDARLDSVENNVTDVDTWRASLNGRLSSIQDWSHQLQNGHHNVVNKLDQLELRMQYHHIAPHIKSGSLSNSLLGVSTVADKTHSKSHLSSSSFSELYPTDVHSKPQKDQNLVEGDDKMFSLVQTTQSLKHQSDISGEGGVQPDLGSGEGSEFFILEEEKYPEQGSGEIDETVNRTDTGTEQETNVTDPTQKQGLGTEDNITKRPDHQKPIITPTPLTTNTVPTLTHPTFTFSTSPLPPCPTLGDFAQLRQRVDDLETRVEILPAAEDLMDMVTNHTARVDVETTKRDQQLHHLQENMADLGTTVSRLAGQLASIRLGDFMARLQSSLLNFTANVLTLEQWHVASQQIMNTTQRTQQRLTELGARVMDNSQMTSELQMALKEHQVMSNRQYRLLQTHVIRLNNSLQDLYDQVNTLAVHKPRRSHSVHTHFAGSSSQSGAQGAVLTSRVDDLALQLVYSDNRLSHLETKMLNSSLSTCKKSNNDLYQDASLLRMDQHLTNAQQDILDLKDTVKRIDLGLYRLHGNSKAMHEVVRKVKGQVKDVIRVNGQVQELRSEMDNLLFQMPIDCEDYYQRGYRQSGDYVIYPRHAPHSLKVRCIMHLANDRDDDGDDKDSTNNKQKEGGKRSKGKKGKKTETGIGGWTVIQQRHSGKVNFTKSWAEYAVGFGSTQSEYWLGNEHLYFLTLHRNYTLAITLTDIFGGHWRATYHPFSISNKDDNYRLTLGSYQGNATDTLRYSSGVTFSTYDKDTDHTSSPCARYNGGGWWYSHCQTSNLNGPYDVGMIWFQSDWKDWLQLRRVVMMIRPEL